MTAGNTRLNQTGNGVTFTFPAFTGHIFNIGESEESSNPINDSDLGNGTHESFIPGDLITPGKLDLEIGFTGALPALNVPGTAVITFPKLDGSAGAGHTLTGSGFFYKRTSPQAANGQILKAKLGFQFDAKASIAAWAAPA